MDTNSDGLACEDCRKIDGISWRSGAAGRKLLCDECGQKWAASEETRPSMLDADSDIEVEDAVNSADAKPHAMDTDETEKIVIRPYFPPQPKLSSIERPTPNPLPVPKDRMYVVRVMASKEPFVVFLNKMNPGLGVAAPLLRKVGICSESDFQRMPTEWWPEFFHRCIEKRGLTAFDDFLLNDNITKYLKNRANVQDPPPSSHAARSQPVSSANNAHAGLDQQLKVTQTTNGHTSALGTTH